MPFHHVLQRLAGDEVDLECQPVSLGPELRVLQGPLEGPAKRLIEIRWLVSVRG